MQSEPDAEPRSAAVGPRPLLRWAHRRRQWAADLPSATAQLLGYLGRPVTPMPARMLAREVDGTDFRLSRNGDGAVPAAAHSLRQCRGSDGATVQAVCYLG